MAFDRFSESDIDVLDDVLIPGTLLMNGQYRIGAFLNSGGFGNTYLAKDGLARDVVLKECFAPAFCRRSGGRVYATTENNKLYLKKVIRSLITEAQILSSLSHPNIVRVHQVFEENDTAYMALDYIKGHDLLEIIDEKTPLSPQHIVTMARKLVAAVAHIHDRQLLHCDISPDNICLGSDGEPVLIDFGSARKSEAGIARTNIGFTMVKDGYSPPELYVTSGTCGRFSDIYSLGASLYHAITGLRPVDGQTRFTALSDGRPDPLTPLAGTLPGYPPGFLASIDAALCVDTASRHATAQDWLAMIDPLRIVVPRKVALLRRVAVISASQPASQTCHA